MGKQQSRPKKTWQDTISLATDVSIPFSALLKNTQLFKLLFIPHQARSDKAQLTIKHLKEFMGNNVKIVQAQRYKVPLSEKQFTALIFYHEYLVLKTVGVEVPKSFFWAFEKNQKHIRVTFSTKKQRVVDFGYGEIQGSIQKRLKGTYWKPKLLQSKETSFDLYQLIKWAYQCQIQNQQYSLLRSNCQVFSRKVFKIVTNDSNK